MQIEFQSLGWRVRSHRAACGLNQTQLADLLGSHQQDISLIENGKRKPKLPMMTKINAWLKTSAETVRLRNAMKKKGATRKGKG